MCTLISRKRYTNLDINDLLDTVPNNFDATFFFAFVQSFELAFLLPIVYRTDYDLEIIYQLHVRI